MSYFLHLNNLTFSYENSLPLINNLTQTFGTGWTGIAGANGSGKSTLLKLICGELTPQRGTVQLKGGSDKPNLVYLPQNLLRKEEARQLTDRYLDALNEGCGNSHRWLGLLEIEYEWFYRQDSLSFGEQRRLQLAAALSREPECLCLDEPVNHLDEKARTVIRRALRQYRGIGLIVSHDRHLLNELPRALLLLSPSGAVFRHGNYSHIRKEQEKEDLGRQRTREKALHQVKKLEKEASRRRALAASQHKRRSKKNLDLKDSDGRARLDLVRVSGKDGTGGKLLRQMDGRLLQARKELEQSCYSNSSATGITLKGARIDRDFLYRREACELPLSRDDSKGGNLNLPDLEIIPGNRISLTGRNGAGKSTLIHSILTSEKLHSSSTLYLPQEFSLRECEELMQDFRNLNRKELGETLSAVARLGSSPEALRDSASFSPGEARKVFLAMALCREVQPEFLVLDEPENHLDLPAIAFLESALLNYNGTLLLVSHDREFREKLTCQEWNIEIQGETRILKQTF